MRILRMLGLATATLGCVLAVALAGLVLALQPPPPLLPAAPISEIRGVHLVEPGGRRLRARTLRIEAGRISAIEPVAGSAHTNTPFGGMTLLPGLIDMHVHEPMLPLPGHDELFAFLFLAHGITSVRVTSAALGDDADASGEDFSREDVAGPHAERCGPLIDGPDPVFGGALVVRNATEARDAARRTAKAGRSCVKAYDGLSEESVIALREEAHALGLSAIGHVPLQVELEVALLDDVQHLRGVYPAYADPPGRYPNFLRNWSLVDDARIARVIEASLEYEIAFTPTLVTIERLLAARDYDARVRNAPSAKLLPRVYTDVLWSPLRGLTGARFMNDTDFDMVERSFARMRAAVRALHDAGVPIHAGTDSGVPGVVPGAALWRELRLLSAAGLGPEQALASATTRAARFLALEGGARLEVGAPADFAIFRDDPTSDLAHLDSLAAVVRAGRLYNRDELDAQLASYQEQWSGLANDRALPWIAEKLLDAAVAVLRSRAGSEDRDGPG